MAREKRKIKRVKPKPYTGLTPVQPVQRQSAGPFPTGSTSITQSGAVQEEGNGGGLTGLLAGKEAYDQMGSMHQSGKDLRKGIDKLPDKFDRGVDYVNDKFVTPVTDWYNDTNTLTDMSQLPQGGLQYPGGVGTIGLGSSPAQNVANRWDLAGSSAQLGSQAGTPASYLAEPMASHWGTGLSPALKDAVLGDSSVALGPTTQTLDGARITGTGLQGAEAGAGVGAKAGILSKAGPLVGMGLNAYDMTENGVNAGNALGLAGSGMLAASAFNPALAALGPWGWAAMGVGALGSAMEWW